MAPLFYKKNSDMLRRIYIPLVLVLLLTVFSCSKKTEKPVLDDPYAVRIDLSNKDTVEVSNLVNQYFERLKARDIDGALSMIYYLKGDSIVDVPESIRSKQRMALQMFPGVRYEVDHYIFLTETDCEVKYYTVLFEKEPGDKRPNTMGFLLKPIRRDGKWYLTMADRDDDNTTHSNIPK